MKANELEAWVDNLVPRCEWLIAGLVTDRACTVDYDLARVPDGRRLCQHHRYSLNVRSAAYVKLLVPKSHCFATGCRRPPIYGPPGVGPEVAGSCEFHRNRMLGYGAK